MSKKETKAELQNFELFTTKYEQLKNLALNMFVWTGFPEDKGIGVNVDYLEEKLHERGLVVVANDPEIGLICLPAHKQAYFNIYNKPIKYTLFGINYQKTFNAEDVVPIRNNNLELSTFAVLQDYANKIADVQRTIDVLVNAHKSPFIVVSDQKSLLSLKTAYKQIENNEPMIVVDKGMGIENIKSVITPTPYIIDKLYDYKQSLYFECLTFLGIDNMNIDKRERMVVDEVNSNNDLINQNAQIMLKTRQQAVELINKKFGLNVTCKLRNQPEFEDEEEDKGDEDNDV